MFDHNTIETCKPVHLRHVNVKRDDVRGEFCNRRKCLPPVTGKTNFEIRLRRENLADELAHQRRVIDHEYFDHCHTGRVSLPRMLLVNVSSRPRSARLSSSKGSNKSTMRSTDSRLITERTSAKASPVRSGAALSSCE